MDDLLAATVCDHRQNYISLLKKQFSIIIKSTITRMFIEVLIENMILYAIVLAKDWADIFNDMNLCFDYEINTKRRNVKLQLHILHFIWLDIIKK